MLSNSVILAMSSRVKIFALLIVSNSKLRFVESKHRSFVRIGSALILLLVGWLQVR